VVPIPPAPAWIVLGVTLLMAGASIAALGVRFARRDEVSRTIRLNGLVALVAGVAVLAVGLETDADVAAWLLIFAGAIGGAVSARVT
jgi:hypothetical protein